MEENVYPIVANAEIPADMARLNITYRRQNGDLRDLVRSDLTNDQVCRIAQEAIRAGNVPGIAKDEFADLQDFVAEPVLPTAEYPYHRYLLHPKTPFGAITS